jgi:hypothetical protein
VPRLGILLALLCATPARAGSLDDAAAAVARHAPGGDTAIRVRARDAATGRLAQELAGLLVGRVGGGVEEDAAAAARAGYGALLEVEVAAEAGELVLLGRVLDVERLLWRPAGGGVAATFVERAPLDAELRAWLGGPTATAPILVARRWSFRQVGPPVDLGSPLLALAAADLDGDRRAELVALTADEVVVLRLDGGAPAVLARAALAGPPPLPRPRIPLGTLVAGERILARSSEHAGAAALVWKGGALAPDGAAQGYPTCAGPATLVPGLPLLAGVPSLPERFLSAGCGGGLTAAVDAGGTLRAGASAVADVGAAFAIADLDGDGTAELVASAYRPPGTGDLLGVRRLDDGRPLRPPATVRGGVAAIAAGDLDGDGAIDAIAATRAPGASEVELWLLE